MSHSTFHNGITFNMSWRNVTALYKAGHPARINPEHPGNEKEKTGASGRRRVLRNHDANSWKLFQKKKKICSGFISIREGATDPMSKSTYTEFNKTWKLRWEKERRQDFPTWVTRAVCVWGYATSPVWKSRLMCCWRLDVSLANTTPRVNW